MGWSRNGVLSSSPRLNRTISEAGGPVPLSSSDSPEPPAAEVSRETPRTDIDVRTQLFGDRLPHVEIYADLLATVGVARGLLGRREAPRIWDRHILNCGVIAPLFRGGASICDVGSGAGLPGIVLALARPDVTVTVLDPLLRRTTFLAEVIAKLALPVRVVRARAEEAAGSICADYVTARAVAPLAQLATWALPLCAPGGELVALKGSSAAAEVAAAAPALRRLGAGPARIEEFGQGVVQPVTTVVRIQSAAS